jgi:xylose isomerase
VHPIELFEYFYTLKINGWEGVWQLDQFPFREDTVEAAKLSIRFLKAMYRSLEQLDIEALKAAQSRQDALGAQKLVQDVLFANIRGEG